MAALGYQVHKLLESIDGDGLDAGLRWLAGNRIAHHIACRGPVPPLTSPAPTVVARAYITTTERASLRPLRVDGSVS